jgi:hypothetical protein
MKTLVFECVYESAMMKCECWYSPFAVSSSGLLSWSIEVLLSMGVPCQHGQGLSFKPEQETLRHVSCMKQ